MDIRRGIDPLIEPLGYRVALVAWFQEHERWPNALAHPYWQEQSASAGRRYAARTYETCDFDLAVAMSRADREVR